MNKVGFIGLGIMGAPMSRNLMKAGYPVMVFNRSRGPMEAAARDGAEMAESLTQLAASCNVIFTMLPNSPQVKEVVLGEGGIASAAKPGTLIIDMTSGAPGDSKDIYAALKNKDIHIIDAPVSGGEPMAIAGTLAIMVGGDKTDFERALPYLKAVGSGNTCKLTNQVIVAINIAGLAEGLMLAEKAGADTQLVFEAIKGGLAGSNVMNAKAPMMLADNYKPGFKIDLHIKDLTNAMNTGSLFEAPLPLTEQMLDIMRKLSASGDGSSDHSAVAKHYEELGGVNFAK